MITTTETTTYTCDQCGVKTNDHLTYEGWIVIELPSGNVGGIGIIEQGNVKQSSFERKDFHEIGCLTNYIESIRIG